MAGLMNELVSDVVKSVLKEILKDRQPCGDETPETAGAVGNHRPVQEGDREKSRKALEKAGEPSQDGRLAEKDALISPAACCHRESHQFLLGSGDENHRPACYLEWIDTPGP